MLSYLLALFGSMAVMADTEVVTTPATMLCHCPCPCVSPPAGVFLCSRTCACNEVGAVFPTIYPATTTVLSVPPGTVPVLPTVTLLPPATVPVTTTTTTTETDQYFGKGKHRVPDFDRRLGFGLLADDLLHRKP